jgi:hypothetical protein
MNENKVEILYHTSSAPKVLEDCIAVYTKGGLLCCQLSNGLILKYPLVNVFSVAQYHGRHLGTTMGDSAHG